MLLKELLFFHWESNLEKRSNKEIKLILFSISCILQLLINFNSIYFKSFLKSQNLMKYNDYYKLQYTNLSTFNTFLTNLFSIFHQTIKIFMDKYSYSNFEGKYFLCFLKISLLFLGLKKEKLDLMYIYWMTAWRRQ